MKTEMRNRPGNIYNTGNDIHNVYSEVRFNGYDIYQPVHSEEEQAALILSSLPGNWTWRY